MLSQDKHRRIYTLIFSRDSIAKIMFENLPINSYVEFSVGGGKWENIEKEF